MIKPVARGSPDRAEVLASTSRVPNHVVHRAFAHETVVLNLKTGRYHGLNPTAGAMLDELECGRTLAEAAARLAERFRRPLEEIERDLAGLCLDLLERGLVTIDSPAIEAPEAATADGTA